MGEQLALFARFFYRPSRAASDALDKGSIAFAIAVAVLVLFLWRTLSPFALAVAFLVMTPVAIVIIAVWDGLGSVGMVLRREYVAMLVPGLLAWSAAYLPFGVLHLLFRSRWLPLVAHIVFVVLFVVCLRTALGTTAVHAGVATLCGWAAAMGVGLLWPFVGGFAYFLMSPWLLFILYRYYSPDVRALGDAMSSRRHFRQQLEASMVNPRDADAHYQLGLIYEQRRQFELAETSFRQAVGIRPTEAEAQLHLGRVLRAQGRSVDALFHIEAALREDPKVSLGEGWRDYGGALLDAGRPADAVAALERYTAQREYDPEGLLYYGSALQAMGRSSEARDVFERALAAVDTAPKYRRGQLRLWASKARGALKELR